MVRLALGLALVLFSGSQGIAGMIFSEDFEDGVADGITVIYPTFQIGGGLRGSNFGFHSPNPPSVGQIFRIDGIQSDNITIQFDFVLQDLSFGDLDLILNGDITNPLGGGNQGYAITIHPKNSDSTDAITKFDGSSLRLLHPRRNGVILAGETHTLKVEHHGPSIKAYLDNSLYMQGVDAGSPLVGGSIYIRLFSSGTIDNITIMAVPEPSTLLSGLLGLSLVGLFYLRSRSNTAP